MAVKHWERGVLAGILLLGILFGLIRLLRKKAGRTLCPSRFSRLRKIR